MRRYSFYSDGRDPNAQGIELGAGPAPRLGAQPHLKPPDFWSNLKDFLTQRSLKLPKSTSADVFKTDGLDNGFSESCKAFFRPGCRIRRGSDSSLAQGMEIDWQPGYRVFLRNLRDLIAPPKLPPLKLTSKPVAVPPIWAPRKEFSRAQAAAMVLHAALAVVIFGPFLYRAARPIVIGQVTPVEFASYRPKLSPGKDIAHGGGSGGEHNPLPASRGTLPKFSMIRFTPPVAAPPHDPKLPAEPTLLGPPELRISSPDEAKFGDPLANFLSASAGPGAGGGSGNGKDGGIGDGDGPGYGPGKGGGTGGNVFHSGSGGVGYPTCLYCPAPEYSEDARKAKYQGTVVLQVLIEPDGHATNIMVMRGPGLGLEEKAMEAVRMWRFRPALGPNSKPVETLTALEINFRLL